MIRRANFALMQRFMYLTFAVTVLGFLYQGYYLKKSYIVQLKTRKFVQDYSFHFPGVNLTKCDILHNTILSIIKRRENSSASGDPTEILQNQSHNFFSEKATGPNGTIEKSCFSDISLKHFHKELYIKAISVVTKYECSSKDIEFKSYGEFLIHLPNKQQKSMKTQTNHANSSFDDRQLEPFVSKHSSTLTSNLALFTTVSHSNWKQFVYINVIMNWAHLTPNAEIQPVLFISDLDTIEKSGILLYLAYIKDWVIMAVPRCTRSRLPLLNSMYAATQHTLPHSQWYGYANGDILFTPNLWTTVNEINSINAKLNNTQVPYTFISSRRRDAKIQPSSLIVNYTEVNTLNKKGKLRSGWATDLFIYHKSLAKYTGEEMPPFAIARRGFDNWLVFDVIRKKLNGVDITKTCHMVHIAVTGEKNGHHGIKKDRNYNMRLTQVRQSGPWLRKPYSITQLKYQTSFVKIPEVNASNITMTEQEIANARTLYRIEVRSRGKKKKKKKK